VSLRHDDPEGSWRHPGQRWRGARRTRKRRFLLVLIKPSHYDDDGYVIRWWRTLIPSNSLAAVYALAADCARRQVLGVQSRNLMVHHRS